MAGMAPRRQLCSLFQRQLDTPEVQQQAEVLEVVRTIAAISVLGPFRPRQPALAFVEADRVRADAQLAALAHRSA